MKAERRHELRDNDLLHMLEVARVYLSENGGRVGLLIVVVLVVVTALSLGVRSRAAASEDSWMLKSQLDFSDVEKGRVSLAELATLAEQSSDDSFILSALLERGQRSLELCQNVPFPPDEKLNEVAREALTNLRKRFPQSPLAIGASLTGLAAVEGNAFVLDADASHLENARSFLLEARDSKALMGLPFQRIAIEKLGRLEQSFRPVVTLAPELVIEDQDGETGSDTADTDGGDADIDTP